MSYTTSKLAPCEGVEPSSSWGRNPVPVHSAYRVKIGAPERNCTSVIYHRCPPVYLARFPRFLATGALLGSQRRNRTFTSRLSVGCSAVELSGTNLERGAGIEPALPAWKAVTLHSEPSLKLGMAYWNRTSVCGFAIHCLCLSAKAIKSGSGSGNRTHEACAKGYEPFQIPFLTPRTKNLVRKTGLEPVWISPGGFKPPAFANLATSG